MSGFWVIGCPNGASFPADRGQLEVVLTSLRRAGHDEFTVTAPTESPGAYVPELERPEVPDTIPDEWLESE